jgi:putative phosphoribosyl transferase
VTFQDRGAAGDVLARHLAGYAATPGVIVLGLVRGGVPVAARVARALDVPMDVLVVRKLGVPWSPEVAFGALGPGAVRVLNREVSDGLSETEVSAVTNHERAELYRRERLYRSGRPPLDVAGRTVILIDDGLATGATARAGVAVARRMGASTVVVAAPIGSPQAVRLLDSIADRVVCPLVPPDFGAVSQYYDDFTEVGDVDVVTTLRAGSTERD